MVALCGHGYTVGGLSLLPLPMTSQSTEDDLVCVQTWGEPNDCKNKVILLFGDDLTRKESFKDALINYLFDIKVQDTHRLILVDDHVFEGRSRVIRVYVFNQKEEGTLPFNLVLVDVPPLGAVSGTEGDVALLQVLEEFLETEFGTDSVDGINLMAPSSHDPLHAFINTYRLLHFCFDDLEDITQVLVTDSISYTSLLNSLKENGFKYRNCFVFDSNDRAASGVSSGEYFFGQIFRHFDFHGVDDFFQEMRELSPQRMTLRKAMEEGLLKVGELSRLRVVDQYTEVVGSHKSLTLRKLLMEVEHRDEAARTEHLILGDANDKPTRTIVLIGDRGSGKTTLLTAIVNHIFGVKFLDRFRLLVSGDPLNRLDKDQNLRKTKFTTAFTFNALPWPYDQQNITIIDTPGFKSSEEQTHNKNIVTRLTSLRQACNVHHFSIIGFVTTAGTEKLSDSYKLVFKHLYSLLTDEGDEKIIVLATRSDAKSPSVYKELQRLELSYSGAFKFNCHSLLTDVLPQDAEDTTHEFLSRLYWKMEEYSIGCLFAELVH